MLWGLGFGVQVLEVWGSFFFCGLGLVVFGLGVLSFASRIAASIQEPKQYLALTAYV